MAKTKAHTTHPGFHYHIDPEATSHDLMNEATEWLQYARSLTRLLADFIHEADTVDCQRVAHGMEAIGALMHMGCSARRRRMLGCVGSRGRVGDFGGEGWCVCV